MTARTEAEGHLKKAQDFLEAAQTDLEFDLFDPATSNAVLAGINAKDVICLMLTGTTKKTENHNSAIGELKIAGQAGADVVSAFSAFSSSRRRPSISRMRCRALTRKRQSSGRTGWWT